MSFADELQKKQGVSKYPKIDDLIKNSRPEITTQIFTTDTSILTNQMRNDSARPMAITH